MTNSKKPDPEKLSAYECGFEPFNDSRMEFDVRFYLVAILFIIFDLEIAFLFPWAISLGQIGIFGFISMDLRLSMFRSFLSYEYLVPCVFKIFIRDNLRSSLRPFRHFTGTTSF